MKKYGVSIPITGYIYKEVEAESEEEAKNQVFQMDIITDDIEEWEMHEHITKGNVFYGSLNEMDIEELD